MKKTFIMIQIIIIVCSCCIGPKIRYYQGHIYTIDRQPIQGLIVFPGYCRHVGCSEDYTAGSITDENGHFKFRRGTNSVSYLLFIEFDEKDVDSVQTTWLNHRERVIYFIDGTNDTILIDITDERRRLSIKRAWRR